MPAVLIRTTPLKGRSISRIRKIALLTDSAQKKSGHHRGVPPGEQAIAEERHHEPEADGEQEERRPPRVLLGRKGPAGSKSGLHESHELILDAFLPDITGLEPMDPIGRGLDPGCRRERVVVRELSIPRLRKPAEPPPHH